jgi:hypothetical protein
VSLYCVKFRSERRSLPRHALLVLVRALEVSELDYTATLFWLGLPETI